MFSLLLSVIGIALTIALIAATMHFGGSLFDKGMSNADTARVLSEVQQIRGAIDLYTADHGEAPTDLTALAPNYLAAFPEKWVVAPASQPTFTNAVAYPLGADNSSGLAACNEVNARMGWTADPPACSALPDGFTGCCAGG